MIRIIGALMLMSASAAAGVYMSSRLKKRADSLDGFASALEYLKTRICFADTALEKALRAAGDMMNDGRIFYSAADNMNADGIKKAWRHAVINSADTLCLTAADVQTVSALGNRLGLTDAEDQKRNIDAVLAALSARRAQAHEAYDKNGRLFRGCGILCGALAALLLI